MSSNAINEMIAASSDVPILHFYGLEIITLAKRINISSLKLKGSKMDIEEWLKDSFGNKKQIILAPYAGGSAHSLDTLPFEDLEHLAVFKPAAESSAIVGDHNVDAYNAHRLNYITVSQDEKPADPEKPAALDSLRVFIHNAVLENLAANIHKGFASYFNKEDSFQLLLLDNRKIYTMDKTKIKNVEAYCKKQDALVKNSEARAALPPTSENLLDKLPIKKPAQKQQSKSLKGGKSSGTRLRKEVCYNKQSEYSSSSVERPDFGVHTDDETEEAQFSDRGDRTPILTEQSPLAPVPSLTQSKLHLHSSDQAQINANSPLAFMLGGPSAYYSRIPKPNRDSSKHSKSRLLLLYLATILNLLLTMKGRSLKRSLPNIRKNHLRRLQKDKGNMLLLLGRHLHALSQNLLFLSR